MFNILIKINQFVQKRLPYILMALIVIVLAIHKQRINELNKYLHLAHERINELHDQTDALYAHLDHAFYTIDQTQSHIKELYKTDKFLVARPAFADECRLYAKLSGEMFRGVQLNRKTNEIECYTFNFETKRVTKYRSKEIRSYLEKMKSQIQYRQIRS